MLINPDATKLGLNEPPIKSITPDPDLYYSPSDKDHVRNHYLAKAPELIRQFNKRLNQLIQQRDRDEKQKKQKGKLM